MDPPQPHDKSLPCVSHHREAVGISVIYSQLKNWHIRCWNLSVFLVLMYVWALLAATTYWLNKTSFGNRPMQGKRGFSVERVSVCVQTYAWFTEVNIRCLFKISCFSLSYLYYLLWDWGLSLNLKFDSDRPASPRDFLALATLTRHAGNPNSRPYASLSSSLPTKPSPSPLLHILLFYRGLNLQLIKWWTEISSYKSTRFSPDSCSPLIIRLGYWGSSWNPDLRRERSPHYWLSSHRVLSSCVYDFPIKH